MLLRGIKKLPSTFNQYLSSRNFNCSRVAMSSRNPKEFTIPVPHGCIAGKIWNEGGFPVLGLHGWMDNAGTWDRLAPLLPENVSLFAIDFPGHGLSPLHKPNGSNFLNLVLIIERVVQHFSWEEFHLLGHSMGGGAALMYAATFPKKVKKIIMVDLIKPVSVDPQDQPAKTAQSIQDHLSAEKKLGVEPPCYDYDTIVDRMIKGYGDSITEESAKILLKRGSRQHENGLYSFSYDPKIKVGNILALSFDQQKAFAHNLMCEMLLIKASDGPWYEDKAMYDEIMDIYKEKAKVFKYLTLPGTHHLHLNDPQIVAPVICDFLITKL